MQNQIQVEVRERIEEAIKMARQIEIICERNLEETKKENGKKESNFSNPIE